MILLVVGSCGDVGGRRNVDNRRDVCGRRDAINRVSSVYTQLFHHLSLFNTFNFQLIKAGDIIFRI